MKHSSSLETVMRQLGAEPNVPLARHTFVQVGGPADWFAQVRDRESLIRAVQAARCADVTLTILGAGSNVLIKDGGVRGLVLKNDTRACRELGNGRIEVDSGIRFAALARSTARAGLSGLEWSAGIPGAIGGGLPTNAGAYGADLADILLSIETIAPNGETAHFTADDLNLAYRSSRLRPLTGSSDLAGHIITSLTLQLQRGDPDTALAEIDRVEALRKANAPAGPSLGSTFKNPHNCDRTAGQLIEAAALKGERIGAAQVSDLHANYILNVDVAHAQAADFLALIQRVQDRVESRFSVHLEPEIAVIGEETHP